MGAAVAASRPMPPTDADAVIYRSRKPRIP
jgi:hypothetical protein